MGYYKIIRKAAEGKEVRGTIYEVQHYFNKRAGQYVERLTPICETMENKEYMIPALCYRVQVTKSPRFGRLLPVLMQVPGRTGIRVHRGSKPEHSKGCVLVSKEEEKAITERWLSEQKAGEETRVEVCDAGYHPAQQT